MSRLVQITYLTIVYITFNAFKTKYRKYKISKITLDINPILQTNLRKKIGNMKFNLLVT